jgi:hypothetical protein
VTFVTKKQSANEWSAHRFNNRVLIIRMTRRSAIRDPHRSRENIASIRMRFVSIRNFLQRVQHMLTRRKSGYARGARDIYRSRTNMFKSFFAIAISTFPFSQRPIQSIDRSISFTLPEWGVSMRKLREEKGKK